MRIAVSVVFLILAVSIYEIGGLPLNSDSAIWHKITKRDTAAVPPTENKNNASATSAKEATDSKTTGNEDELIETQPDSPLPEPLAAGEKTGVDAEQSTYNSEKPSEDESDSNSERSIDWQLLSGNPADLERELESRRRRRSVRSSSLSRQHRIRTTGHVQRSRSKRDTYYNEVNPSDLLAAYAYLQSRRQEQEQEEQPQLALLGDANDGDLSDLASLIYELQRADDQGESPVDEPEEDDQQVLPTGYVDFEPTNDYEPEIRVSPEQLAALEQVLSEQQRDDGEDDDSTGLYPKDKRAEPMFANEEEGDQDQEDDGEEEPEPTYLIPVSMEPSNEYVQIPLASAYENPYDFYQVDEDPNVYEDAVRRLDEEQLRQRIASLVDDINEQRRIARRRRRR